MKNVKKLLALLLSALMVMSFGMTVFADDKAPGSITINDSVSGKAYDLYRIFDLTGKDTSDPADGVYDNVAYTIAAKWTGFFADGAAGASYITDTNSGNLNPIVVEDETKYINITDANVSEFAQKALAFAAANNIAYDKTVTGNGDDLTVDDLALGYYMVYPKGAADIKEGFASICSLTSTVPSAQINIKAVYPTIDKNITEAGEEPTKVNEAGIGDTVPFTLTTQIPDMTGYTKYFFVVHDTLSDGLTLVNTPANGKNPGFTVTVGTDTLVEGTDYDVDIDGHSFRIIFKDMVNKRADDVGKTVTITYSAILNENALINAANPNTAKIEYSNDPYVTPQTETGNDPDNPDDPDDEKYTFKKDGVEVDPTGESEDSVTETYTTSLTILKVDGEGAILSGAEFTLTGDTNKVKVTTSISFVENAEGTYYKLANGSYTEAAPVNEGVEEADDGAYVVLENDYVLQDGQETFTIGGITYRAIRNDETISNDTTRYSHILGNTDKYANDGKMYKKTTVTETHTDSLTDDIKGTVDPVTGLVIFEGLGAGTYTLTESVTPEGYNTIIPIEFTVSFNPSEKTFTGTNPINLKLTEIVNQSGTVLPETGGKGKVIIIAAGAVLLLAAGIVLTAKKRLYNEG